MKKLTACIIVFLLIILVSQSCKKHKYEKELIGKWSSSITSCPGDTNIYNKVVIEFAKNDAAYINYNSPLGYNRWSTPYKCKWWIKKEKSKYYLPKNKHWFLYILRYDTIADPCPCPYNCMGSFYAGITFPDTTQYVIHKLDDNSLKLELARRGFSTGDKDLFFSESDCYWFCPTEKTLNKNY